MLFSNQKGQAVTEYILVLVVVVAIILGGMYQLNSAFQVWANNYFGEYLTCLLETGELPSIGGSPGDSGICNDFFKPFNFAEGRPSNVPPITGEPGTPTDSKPETRGGGENGGGARESVGARSRVGGSGSSFSRRSRAGGGSERSQNIGRMQKNRAKYTGSTESSVPGGAGSASSWRGDQRVQYVKIERSRVVDLKEDDEEANKGTSSVKKDGGSQEINSGRIKLNRRDVAKTQEVEDEPFTIGNFLRILIIAAIILALVVLLGGQALQISKGSD